MKDNLAAWLYNIQEGRYKFTEFKLIKLYLLDWNKLLISRLLPNIKNLLKSALVTLGENAS